MSISIFVILRGEKKNQGVLSSSLGSWVSGQGAICPIRQFCYFFTSSKYGSTAALRQHLISRQPCRAGEVLKWIAFHALRFVVLNDGFAEHF